MEIPATPALFAAPMRNAVLSSALPCSLADPASLSCAAVDDMLAQASSAASPSPPSLTDAYRTCRAAQCRAQLAEYTAAATASTALVVRDLVARAEALGECAMAACPDEYARAHARVCVPLAHRGLESARPWLIAGWDPPIVPTQLQNAIIAAKASGVLDASLGICAVSLPLGTACDASASAMNSASGLVTPAALGAGIAAGQSGANLTAFAFRDTLVVPKVAGVPGTRRQDLAFPANFYSPSLCSPDSGTVASAAPLGAPCARHLDCRLGACRQSVCRADLRTSEFVPVADLPAAAAAAIPDTSASPFVPVPTAATSTGIASPNPWTTVAIFAAPFLFIALGVAAVLHDRRVQSRKSRVAEWRGALFDPPSSMSISAPAMAVSSRSRATAAAIIDPLLPAYSPHPSLQSTPAPSYVEVAPPFDGAPPVPLRCDEIAVPAPTAAARRRGSDTDSATVDPPSPPSPARSLGPLPRPSPLDAWHPPPPDIAVVPPTPVPEPALLFLNARDDDEHHL
ncbi:hypothetical protein H9P43_004241 [Blastocladiella emersonii ATCC 22665]|nr:hypothetical protein H9P43_004241 [Blastocladiella emersonii ATCC 22665]